MIERLRKFIFNLYSFIPTEVFEGLLITLFVGAILTFYFFGWRRGWKKVVELLLADYLTLLYCSTVIFREVKDSYRYNYNPFWSYDAIREGHKLLLTESIMNVLAFMPVGFLVGLITMFYKNKKFSQKFLKGGGVALVLGLCISVSVEVLQLFLKCGLSEIDDVMHNTLGCLIGFMIVAIIKGIWDFCSFLFWPQRRAKED